MNSKKRNKKSESFLFIKEKRSNLQDFREWQVETFFKFKFTQKFQVVEFIYGKKT